MSPPPRVAAPALLGTAAFAALLLAACASLEPHLVAPTVQVTAVRLQGGSLAREQLQLTVHIVNPNDRAIPIDRLTADVDLAATPFATGVTDAAFILPANGSFDVLMNVTANMGNGLILLAGHAQHRTIHYRIHGEVHLQRGIVRTLHYSHEGDLHY